MDAIIAKHQFTAKDTRESLMRFVRLDNPGSYPFDEFHAHEYHELLVFLEGGGSHNINFTEYEIQNRSLHLLAAGDVHWLKRGMQSNGFAIVFKEEFLILLKELNPHLKFFDFFSRSQVINLNEAEYSNFAFILTELLSFSHAIAYQQSLTVAFLTKTVEKFYTKETAPPVSGHQVVVKLINLINRHYTEQISAAAYAQKAGCSLSTLEKKVKKATGKTISQLQQEKLLHESKRLLCKPDSCAKGTAYSLGFKEASYFSHWFKKLTGLPPLKFKDSAIPVLWALGCLIQDNAELFLP